MPDQNQLDHEKFTAEKIVTLCGEGVQFERFGDATQGEPDVLFLGPPNLGIEVTTAYYEGDAADPNFWAKDIWKFIREPKFDNNGIYRVTDPKTGKPKGLDNQIERLASFCQLRLNQKSSKVYSGAARFWLAIYAHAPITEPHEFDETVSRLSIPSSHPFDRIFILHRIVGWGDGYRALQIFPKATP